MYRPVVMGKNGLVTSGHPLASLAGLDVLKEGGNAFDASIAVSAVLGVVEPHSNGIGGDAYYLIYLAKEGLVIFLNGSGRSPLEASIENIRARGYERLPQRGILSVTVPGCVHSWGELWKKGGSLPLERLLAPAVFYAREGFALSHHSAWTWDNHKEIILQDPGLRSIFTARGRMPKPGDLIRQEGLSILLEGIGRNGTEFFYQGEVAQQIHDFVSKKGGLLTRKDLELHTSAWAEPLRVSYGPYTIYGTPPNTQGLAALLAFNILEGIDVASMGSESPEFIHYLVETKKLAYQYREQYITDPEFVPVDYEDILDKQFASRLRKMILPAQTRPAGGPQSPYGDTVSYVVADREGNVLAGIQSLFAPFGAGCCMEERGIILQNRGTSFSLDPGHINRLEPHKRTFHTLTACLVTEGGKPFAALSSTGGHGQPQTHLQVLTRILHYGQNIQEAIEAPRWLHGSVYSGESAQYLNMEGRFPVEVVGTLESWGHNVCLIDDWADETGKAQGIVIDPDTGVYWGGADPRADGYAVAY